MFVLPGGRGGGCQRVCANRPELVSGSDTHRESTRPPPVGEQGHPRKSHNACDGAAALRPEQYLVASSLFIFLFPLDVAPPVHKCELIKQGPPSRQPQCCKRKQLLRCPSPSSPKTATYPSSPRAVPHPAAPELNLTTDRHPHDTTIYRPARATLHAAPRCRGSNRT